MHTIRLAVDATGNARCLRARGDALYRPDRTERLQMEAQVLETTGLVLPGITLRKIPLCSFWLSRAYLGKWSSSNRIRNGNFFARKKRLLKRAPPGRRGRLSPARAASRAPRQFLVGMSDVPLPL